MILRTGTKQLNGKFSQICQTDLIGLKLSRFVKEEDLDSFFFFFLKGIILPKIIGLSGPLGAGKTTVAKKIIKFFGSNEVVTSPTFNIVKSYEVAEIKIFHVDLYRLNSWSEFIDLDLPLSEDNTLVLIEWASLMMEANIPNMDLIKIEIVGHEKREIIINV